MNNMNQITQNNIITVIEENEINNSHLKLVEHDNEKEKRVPKNIENLNKNADYENFKNNNNKNNIKTEVKKETLIKDKENLGDNSTPHHLADGSSK